MYARLWFVPVMLAAGFAILATRRFPASHLPGEDRS
jgi:hypothetical protein